MKLWATNEVCAKSKFRSKLKDDSGSLRICCLAQRGSFSRHLLWNRRSIINLEFKIGNGVSATLPLARFSVMFLRNNQLRLLLKLLIKVSTYLTLLRKFIIFLKFDDPFLYFSPVLLVFRCVFSGISGIVICYFNCCCTKIEFFVTHFGVRSVFVTLKSIK
ncbi:uncharacterized protein [Spinacia oleracea]|uniref:Uncharacterized protein n=1 Tax=Spinacia oleracea TaxID=3562 RepID=A0ABM3QGC1_SPIOL|nr:uncharacterized protein LOC130459209 [Spinacia oleracea]